jgi:hypothetical protein
MKANELRLGNYVLRNGFLQEDKETFNEIVVSHNDITACVVSFESFKPIPLTEEWLLMFGFEKTSSNFYKKNSIDIQSENDYFLGLVGMKLQYVHQLQNFYFAFYGEELTLKS